MLRENFIDDRKWLYAALLPIIAYEILFIRDGPTISSFHENKAIFTECFFNSFPTPPPLSFWPDFCSIWCWYRKNQVLAAIHALRCFQRFYPIRTTDIVMFISTVII